MRDTYSWRNILVQRLRKQWPDTASISPRRLCDVELGLYCLRSLFASAPAHALWVVLSGYNFPFPEAMHWTDEQRRMLNNARHILTPFKNPFPWQRILDQYLYLPEHLRGYDIAEQHDQYATRPISLCVNRWEVYHQALTSPLKHTRRTLTWADAGLYRFSGQRHWTSVTLPSDLVFPAPAPGHTLDGKPSRSPLTVSWEDLLDTAHWMDTQLTQQRQKPSNLWEILERVQLELFNPDRTALQPSGHLYLDGMLHLIGMVSSGKSTLMNVLAVWMARQGMHCTLVVGDVMGVLERAQLFTDLGLRAAPILGASNRERHTNRLHRMVAASQTAGALSQSHIGFRWLSSACPLDGLRDTAQPLTIGQQPCLQLYAVAKNDEEDANRKARACPLYHVCPFHQAQRDLVAASIWIATPAGLVYTRVAPQINPEQLRFAELVYRRSNLVIVDEADQVQMQLDTIFSPNQTLVSRSTDAWMGRLSQQVLVQLNREGRSQLVEARVATWCQAHDMAQASASRVYALLLQEGQLRQAIEQDYFTEWLLLERLAFATSGKPENRDQDLHYTQLMQGFTNFLSDPLGERSTHPFVNWARQTLTITNSEQLRAELAAWIKAHTAPNVEIQADLADLALILEFALLVAVLSNRLNYLQREWRSVEGPLDLESGSSALFHRPPEDYRAVIPTSPMGNVLAFQYIRPGDDTQAAGDLRFFRCLGVGRWLLLHLHELFAGDGIAGPHVLLLSGTSWAGTSPRYHIQVPVSGILRAPATEIDAINRSGFERKFVADRTGKLVRVSGTTGHGRVNALHVILQDLARRTRLSGGPGHLERVRDSLPDGRQRILLLVGSYDEARRAREFLENIRPEWREYVLHLVPDDDRFDSQWQSSQIGLQRGMVSQFAQTDAWILIAPLLAVERGHNILNEANQAAIGAVYFLVRPHPRPDDISYAVQSINHWAVAHDDDSDWFAEACGSAVDAADLATTGAVFRSTAYRRWRYLLRLPMIYSTLPAQERAAVTWSQLVTIWQVIGRLVRGGSPAQVFFCDAAFDPSSYRSADDTPPIGASLLTGMLDVLHPYFDEANTTVAPADKVLVDTLYGPLYKALQQMKGTPDA